MGDFIVDESTGVYIASWLRSEGHDAISIREILPGLPDEQILNLAVRTDRIVITNDKDFGDLVFRERRPHRGVIQLRLPDNLRATKVAALARLLADPPDDLSSCFVVLTERTIRVTRRGEDEGG